MPMTVGGGVGTDLKRVAEQARELDARGYDFIATREIAHNPFLPATLVAEHTQRALFGTAIAIVFPRVPYITASLCWDLSAFSDGRFILGLGTQVKGHNERRFSVPWAPPGPRIRDYIGCMRAIWDSWQNGTKPNYESEHYRYTLSSPTFNPGPIEHPDIKIVLAALNPFHARLAGEICDGIDIHPLCTPRYTREVVLPALHDGARRAGKDPGDLIVRGAGFMITGRNEEELEQSRESIRRTISFYASTRTYSPVMKLHGWEDEAAHLHRLSIEQRWDEMVGVVTDEMLEQFCAIGTWDELVDRMREQYEGIKTQVEFGATPRNPDEADQIKEIVAQLKTIPALGEV